MTSPPGSARRRRSILATLAALLSALLSALLPAMTPGTAGAQDPELRPLADAAALHLGAAVDAETLDDAAYAQLLGAHVNMLSTRGELSMSTVQPERGVFDFSAADAVVDFAVAHDMAVRGHDLIGPDVPAWVAGGSWTAESLGQVLREHISTVIGRYRERNPGVVIQWDVIGDAALPDGTARPTIWQQVIGDDHLRLAFEAARAADPDAQLFYDDFYDDLAVTQDAVTAGAAIVPGATAQRTTCDVVPKCVGVRDRIAALVADGTAIDGVGFRAHLFSPAPSDLGRLTAWVGELGLSWAVTEFDVPLPVTEITDERSVAFQAEVYGDTLAACVDAPNCDTFVTSGISDRFSPIAAETGGAFDGALWFDAADKPKPAFAAMVDVLTERAVPTTAAPTTAVADTAAPTTAAPTATEREATGSDATGSGRVAVVVGLGALGLIAGLIFVARRHRTHRTR